MHVSTREAENSDYFGVRVLRRYVERISHHDCCGVIRIGIHAESIWVRTGGSSQLTFSFSKLVYRNSRREFTVYF